MIRIIDTLYWDGTCSGIESLCDRINRDLFSDEDEPRLTFLYDVRNLDHVRAVLLASNMRSGEYMQVEPFDSIVVLEYDDPGVAPYRDAFVTKLTRRIPTEASPGIRALREFHETFDGENHQLSTDARALEGDLLELRKTLLREEFEELMEALDEGDVAHAYKEAADLKYVLYGLDVHMGQRLDAVFEEVHKSNMSKVWDDGKVHRREDGKILKPPTYVAPDLEKCLR